MTIKAWGVAKLYYRALRVEFSLDDNGLPTSDIFTLGPGRIWNLRTLFAATNQGPCYYADPGYGCSIIIYPTLSELPKLGRNGSRWYDWGFIQCT
jgi:hypothetical protein